MTKNIRRLAAVAARPGDLVKIEGKVWKILEHRTLDRTLVMERVTEPGHRKRIQYPLGFEFNEASPGHYRVS